MKALIKASCTLVVAVAVLFCALAMIMAKSTATLMVSEAERTVRGVVQTAAVKVDQLMYGVETAVGNSVWTIYEHLNDPDYMYRITHELVRNNEYIVGSTVAFEPDYYKAKGHFFAPYTCESGKGQFKSFQLGTFGGDGQAPNIYYDQDWYVSAKRAGRSIWSEPYFDEGGAKILMSTYSVPLKDEKGKVFAIFTADLSLGQLTDYVAKIRPYANSYAVMKSAAGAMLVKPPLNIGDKLDTITICETAANGWKIEVVCPIETVLEGSRKLIYRIVLFSLLGLGMIFVLAWFYSSRLQKQSALRERMESELNTARNIQNDILPKEFPENISAVLRPAREVGGDLYDFVKVGNTLYFIIGDASGKGVPAALFSFIAETVFRMACALRLNPAEIVGRINAQLVRGNDMCMFVTVFVGALNQKTGCLEYGCAGHNPPVIISPDGKAEFLPVLRNPPAGAIFGRYYEMQSTQIAPGSKILVYTDGVTEAEQADHSQFGEGRLMALAGTCGGKDVRSVTKDLLSAVDAFVAGADPSDDLTIMTIGVPDGSPT